MSDDADRRRAAEALCVRCGLCCDGTFFGSVVVAGGERERLGRVGLRVVDEDGKLSMPQPCSALRGCLCAVYADRPGACRQYECRMRERLLDGSVSEEDARASVRDAFDLQGSSIWEAILAIDALAATDEMSAADGRRLDGGVAALSELLELARDTFEPAAGGGGR